MISVSIIVPVYGVEKHIERCLRSIMRQDYNGPVECLLIDDCGKDKSVQTACDILAGYQGTINFKWIHHEHNRGLSGARNSGIRAAKGDYLFFLDSDDEIITHAISTLVSLAAKHPNVDIVYGDWYVPARYNGLQNKPWLPEYICDPAVICSTLLKGEVSMTAQNKLLRRDYIEANHLYFLEGILHEDSHINCLYAVTAQSIAISKVPTYLYFLNPNGIIGQYGEKNIRSILTLVEDLLNRPSCNFEAMKIFYCWSLLFTTYLQSDHYQLTAPCKEILFHLWQAARQSRNKLLTGYLHALYKMPYPLFKKLEQCKIVYKVNAFVFHHCMQPKP